MIPLIKHIEYLISIHDCVIIPGFGAFIANYYPASYSSETNEFTPPKRIYTFNRSIIHDDGLVIGYISRHEKISFDEAREVLNVEVKTLNDKLAIGQELIYPNLGSFYKSGNGQFVFNSINQSLLTNEYFGLKPIQINSFNRETETPLNKDSVNILQKQNPLKYVASIIVLLVLSFVLSTPISLDKSKSEFASLSFVKEKALEQNEIGRSKVMYISLPKEAHNQKIQSTNRVRIKAPTIVNSKNGIEIGPSNKGRYCLVIASLPSLDLANKYIVEKGNKNLQIIEKDGRYRVYIASHDSYKQLERLKPRYKDSWICSK